MRRALSIPKSVTRQIARNVHDDKARREAGKANANDMSNAMAIAAIRMGRVDAATLVATKRRWDAAYAKGSPVVPDEHYDAWLAAAQRRYPDEPRLRSVAADASRVGQKRVRLPIMVGSLDLLRPKDVAGWMRELERESGVKQKGWLVQPKFDGASLTLRYRDGRLDCAWTRGKVVDGESLGYAVTKTAQMIQGVLRWLRPCKTVSFDGELLVRGEVVMHRSIFEQHYGPDKEGELTRAYKTARNMVAGLINRVDPSPVREDLGRCTFIALQLFVRSRAGKWVRPTSAQAEWVQLMSMGFTHSLNPVRYSDGHYKIVQMVREGHEALKSVLPAHEVGGSLGEAAFWESHPTAAQVVERLNAIHRAVDIRCDGIVVQPLDARFWIRRGGHLQQHPPHVRAIKLEVADQESFEGRVGSIEWNISKRGLLKPRLILAKPIDIDGVEVNHATCHNADFVRRWGLRRGRRIRVTRSGDVIPRITRVLDGGRWCRMTKIELHAGGERTVDLPGIDDPRAATSLPKSCPSCGSSLRWTSTRTDLVCANAACPGRHGQNVLGFFRALGVDDVAAGTVQHLMDSGMDTVAKIMRGAVPRRLMRLEGYQERKAMLVSKAVAGAMRGVPLAKVMHASGLFAADAHSLGSTRLQAIVDAAGEGMVLRASTTALRSKLANQHGLGSRTLDLFLAQLPAFRKFYEEVREFHSMPTGPRTLKGLVVAFTGFRDAQLELLIVKNGGRVAGVSKNCAVLFAASLGSAKCARADKLNIPIVEAANARRWIEARIAKE